MRRRIVCCEEGLEEEEEEDLWCGWGVSLWDSKPASYLKDE